jgi:Resolvase, N terminal domain
MGMTRVCLYTRISTDEENQPTSLHSQRERLEAFCTAQEGWRIVAHQQDQTTGTKLDRPGLQAALDLARTSALRLDPLRSLPPRLRRHVRPRQRRHLPLLRLHRQAEASAEAATVSASPATSSKPPSSNSSPRSTGTECSSAAPSTRQPPSSRPTVHSSKSGGAPSPRRSVAPGEPSTATTKPSRTATSTAVASRRACPSLRRASQPCASKTQNSPAPRRRSRHGARQRRPRSRRRPARVHDRRGGSQAGESPSFDC